MKRNLQNEKNRQKIVDLFDSIERLAGHMEFWIGHMRAFNYRCNEIDEELDDLISMMERVCKLLDYPVTIERGNKGDDGDNGSIKGQKRIRREKERYNTDAYKRLP